MADDLTLGELARNLTDLKSDMRQSLKDSDDRHAALAGKMVPAELWRAEHEALENYVRDGFDRIERTSLERKAAIEGQIGAVRKAQAAHEKAHTDNRAWTRSRTWQAVGIAAGAVAAIVAAWIGAIAAAKGVH